ncbi:MAG: hypothetical protein Gaeavirus5_2 [Gaeavirus sp.]|uniref:Uncharacterized protein n=1 Tax=Gaeavirus sp. TaxID=2487767 RepID=A0A3G4ZYK8_9VIRU|nr:MAG: hypothetical protein Gaeavirus5_2 [Gaeavirus sp.]
MCSINQFISNIIIDKKFTTEPIAITPETQPNTEHKSDTEYEFTNKFIMLGHDGIGLERIVKRKSKS